MKVGLCDEIIEENAVISAAAKAQILAKVKRPLRAERKPMEEYASMDKKAQTNGKMFLHLWGVFLPIPSESMILQEMPGSGRRVCIGTIRTVQRMAAKTRRTADTE
jgi:hypothetical protein